MERYFHDIAIAIESILSNKVKSVLTALGIIFGVAAVISMLAIGNGARQEILEQMKLVGVNNIIVSPVFAEETIGEEDDEIDEQKKFSPGLTMKDAMAIAEIVPTVKTVCPEIAFDTYLTYKDIRKPVKLLGVNTDYFNLFNIQLERGYFFGNFQNEHATPVCVIGSKIKAKLFSKEDPIGKKIKCGQVWMTIIGVVENRFVSESASQKMGISNQNDKIYIPVKTMLMRFTNRALVNSQTRKTDSKINPNQLDKIIVQVEETEYLTATTDVIARLLARRHYGVDDFEITVPELLLKQQQRTKDIFNIVLGAIAGISLIVGGIGIMNIMLASVMERIKEIGTRMAIGAKKTDIIVQFLSEAILISVTGGIIGIMLGLILSKLITNLFDIYTLVSSSSVLIAFGVSVTIGISFGYLPAKRASEQDPVVSLRN